MGRGACAQSDGEAGVTGRGWVFGRGERRGWPAFGGRAVIAQTVETLRLVDSVTLTLNTAPLRAQAETCPCGLGPRSGP